MLRGGCLRERASEVRATSSQNDFPERRAADHTVPVDSSQAVLVILMPAQALALLYVFIAPSVTQPPHTGRPSCLS